MDRERAVAVLKRKHPELSEEDVRGWVDYMRKNMEPEAVQLLVARAEAQLPDDVMDAEAVALVLAACERQVSPEYISAWVRDDWLTEANAVLTCLRERGWRPRHPVAVDLPAQP